DGQYTYADYLQFEYDHMVELIRGKIFKMTPAPASFHQDISRELLVLFSNYLKDKSCKIYNAPFDVVLPVENQKKNSATTVVQPDLSIICDLSKIDAAGCIGAPDLIIEILSPSTSKKDLNDKYSIYEESGVLEYWIVMPNEKLVEVFYLEAGKYNRIKVYTSDEVIIPILFPDLEIDLVEVFKED
ncbi:Uma2 family endonuclease, partial [Saprospiraceae bacterium]|nr:Uma2 family endonuclease [Saprospiraceae bacterium]